MRTQKKTIIVVHHDLQSVEKYFDWVILLNMRMIASGPTQEVFTSEQLRETYGAKLTVLSEMSQVLKKSHFPSRE